MERNQSYHYRMMHLQSSFVFSRVTSPFGILPVNLFMSSNTSNSAGALNMPADIEPDSILLLAITYSG